MALCVAGFGLAASLLVAHADPTSGDAAKKGKVTFKCTVKGTDGPDVLVGTRKRDVICGFRGNDLISARGGKDRVYTGKGRDKAFGEAGHDRLHGDGHGDLLAGAGGADWIYGEAGNDRMSGGPGRDLLFGDGGNDDMSAGGDEGDHALGGAGRNTGDTLVGSGYPDCPSADSPKCVIAMHLSSPVCFPINSYKVAVGSCTGKSYGNSAVFSSPFKPQQATLAAFTWARSSQGVDLIFQVTSLAAPTALIVGGAPTTDPRSPIFEVDDSYALLWAHPSIHFHTENRPGVRPSAEGGPLWLNFEPGQVLDAGIHFWGFMSRR